MNDKNVQDLKLETPHLWLDFRETLVHIWIKEIYMDIHFSMVYNFKMYLKSLYQR